MLTNVKVKNAYSIGDLSLSFIKGKFAYKKEMIHNEIVNPCAIYGGNGSGKTSFINAINDLLNLLIGDKDTFYPLIANFTNKNEDSLIELTLKLDGAEYKYQVVTSFLNSKIVSEFLLKDNRAIFSRNEESVIVENKEYEVKSSLLLSLRELYSIADELIETKDDIKKVYNYLTNFTVVKDTVTSKLCSYKNVEELVVNSEEEIKRIISLWKDFPVYDFLREEDGYYLDLYKTGRDKFRMPGFLISDGMLTINKILAIMLNLDRNSVLFIDCIEKNLHPSSVLHLIREAQKRDIQLIFTSHNTSLMQEFRPDQIYFARWNKGVSYYFRLSNIYENIREINNIEKMYLSNTFDEAINALINIDE